MIDIDIIQANNSTHQEIDQLMIELQEDRQEYYEKLSTFKVFGKGWTRRVDETTELALKMIS